MRILDRYILKKFLTTFVFVVLIMLSVVVVIDLTEKLDKFARYDLDAEEILDYYYSFIPFIASLITPITTFISVVFVTAKLAGHSEIIAILSNGTSFRRMLVPYMIGAVLIAALSFYANGWVVPKSNKFRISFEVKYMQAKYYFSEKDFHIQVAPNQYLYMSTYNNQSNIGSRFTLERFDDNSLVEKLSARRIQWDAETERWKLINWQHKIINDEGETISFGAEMDTSLIIHPREFESNYRLYDGMTIPELKRYVSELEARGAEGKEVYVVETYTRYASPFSILILTFMGVITAARKSRGGIGFQIALGFVLAFIFIIFYVMARSIAEAGSMPAMLGVWLPNIIFTIIAAIMYRTVPR